MNATSPYLNQTVRSLAQARLDRAIAANAAAGGGSTPMNIHEEIARQEEIKKAAWEIMSAAEAALIELAKRSEEHRSHVNADQADWVQTITDVFADLDGDTFGGITQAIESAKREASI